MSSFSKGSFNSKLENERRTRIEMEELLKRFEYDNHSKAAQLKGYQKIDSELQVIKENILYEIKARKNSENVISKLENEIVELRKANLMLEAEVSERIPKATYAKLQEELERCR